MGDYFYTLHIQNVKKDTSKSRVMVHRHAVIPALRRLRKGDHKFVIWGYLERKNIFSE
jgi:hypothetical protein